MSNFSKWKQQLDYIGIGLQSHLQIYLEIAEIAQPTFSMGGFSASGDWFPRCQVLRWDAN